MGHQGLGAVLVVSATSAMLLLGSGVAQAGSSPNVVGQKYSDATSAISGAGLHPVVSTVVGDQKAWPDCLVATQEDRTVPPPENSSGSATNEVLVSLNCYSAEASAKAPGYSAASPEGKAIAAAAKAANSSG
ncbi:MAG: hypothetical protein JWP55_282 [Mycobacterium sp.]|jgi:hypothetical protein|nr:hypothetical protein [Mycobacterium sp.]